MKIKKYDYYHAIIRRAEQLLEMASLTDFVNYVQANQLKQIIITQTETGAPAFAITSKGALYICPTTGYKSLEDFQTSTENGFPEAAIFYEAAALNCSTYAEYQTARTHEITDATEFEEMKTSGYVAGYPAFEEERSKKSSLPRLEHITNVKELFRYAKKSGFNSFPHFMTAWEAGFTTELEHKMALEKGLENSADYEIFHKGGFYSIDEFKQSKPLGITSKQEFEQYSDLHIAEYPGCTFDELLLISIVSKMPDNTTKEFSKLYEFYMRTESSYKREYEPGELRLPRWFTKRMRTEQDMKDFLVSSDQVKLYGTFDAKKNIFETRHIKLRHVVVDGSNVAYNSNMQNGKKGGYGAELKNILTLVKKLKYDYQFEHIHVISDAGLINKVKDKELLGQIKELCKYSETPPGVPADLYLIKHVKKTHCLLITNDNFNDWKLNDKWMKDNIQFYRLTFMLNGDKVLLPYMDKYEKK